MKKYLLLSWGLVAVTGLAFANNVAAIVKWWMKFVQTGGDSAALQSGAGGVLPWLDWSAVDYSGVTTFIPFLGCVCVARGLWRISRRRKCGGACFPFFECADQFNVALGLFGTLWGIIVIGYFQLDKVTMADLMQCLHTALFSTLAAVVWVFMIDHPLLRPFFQRKLRETGLLAEEDGDLAAAVDAFTAKLAAATAAFEKREREFEASIGSRLAEFEKSFSAQLAASSDALQRRLAESGEKFAEADRRFAEHQSELEKAVAIAQGVAVKGLNDRVAEADKDFAERQRKYDEALEKRIAAYEQEAAARLAALKEENESERRRHADEARALAEGAERAREEARKAEDVRAEAVLEAEKAVARATRIEAKLASIRSAVGE